MAEQTSAIRNIYFYLVSFIALGFIVGSSVYLLNYVAKTTVFQKADFTYRGTPPGLFFNTVKDPVNPVFAVTCTDKCSLTDSQRVSITDWQNTYTQWQNQPSASQNRARGLVNALSFLIVALPIFIFHFRTVQHDYRADLAAVATHPDGTKRQAFKTLRSLYFYLVALAAVVMFIISAGATVNTVLKTWVVKSAGTSSASTVPLKIPSSTSSDTEGVKSLLACSDKCGLSADTKQQLTQWEGDYATANQELDNQTKYDWQHTLATSIPFLLASIPLFLLHWLIIQRERKQS